MQSRPSLVRRFRSLPRFVQIVLGIVAFLLIAAGIGGISDLVRGGQPSDSGGTTTIATPTLTQISSVSTPASVPTSVPAVQYPPKTRDDLQGLALRGIVSAIHEFHHETVGIANVCPQPRRDVIVTPNVTGQQLAEDLLAYFYVQHLDIACGSVVFAYHSQGELGNGYTAGRIKLDVTDSSGQSNTDSNATGLTYTLTLDVGDIGTGKEYTVTWQQ